MQRAELLFAPSAWVGGRWQHSVVLQVGSDGRWQAVDAGQPCPPDAQRLPGPALPSLVNAHSHAFQRAFVGLAERRESEHDDFWSWRERMYAVALRIGPEQLHAVATQLYIELLRGGYTQVCEFHYLQHQHDGRPYADRAELCWALADAARDAGIGLTLLPVVYERAGFTQPALREQQRRFAASADEVLALQAAVAGRRQPLLNAGTALHSLRAARPESIRHLAEHASGPLHIHIAEQTGEVDDCLAATGRRPIEWLARHAPLDARWQLVHATHTVPAEIEAVARAGAGVVLCPGTEANLGDGLCDLRHWLASGTALAIGSDSHVTRAWPEELRWLEYGQRVLLRQRNVAAAPASGQPSSAARLFERVRQGGAAACGERAWGLERGARADLLVLDAEQGALLGVPAEALLDATVFAAAERPVRDVLVAGRWVLRQHEHPAETAAAREFVRAVSALHRA